MFLAFLISFPRQLYLSRIKKLLQSVGTYKNSKYSTVVKVFKGAPKGQPFERLEVNGQGEILASQDYDDYNRSHKSTYSACDCDAPLINTYTG